MFPIVNKHRAKYISYFLLIILLTVSIFSILKPTYASSVTFCTNPASFSGSPGYIRVDNSVDYYNGGSASYSGTHTMQAFCGGLGTDYQFVFWDYSDVGNPSGAVYVPNIVANPGTFQAGSGSGWLKATFSAKITFHTNPAIGSISYGSSNTYTEGQTRWEGNLPPTYSNRVQITANVPSGYIFQSWSTSGMLSFDSSSSNPTYLTVNGPGSLTANFQTAGVGGSTWTFMVYMECDYPPDRDSYLGPAATLNKNQMMSVGSTDNVKIAVLDDEWNTNTRYLYVRLGSISERTDYPWAGSNLNFSQSDTLKNFITWTVQQYPAGNYALVLWDHGSGFQSFLPDFQGTQTSSALSLQSLTKALRDANIRLHIIGFDACLMGMIETAYQIYKFSPPDRASELVPDFLVASEETIPGDGWPYNTILSNLVGNPSMSPATFAETIVARYRERYQSDLIWKETTLSAIDLRGTDFMNVMYDVTLLGNDLENKMGSLKSPLSQAITEAQSEHFYFNYYVDLHYLVGRIRNRVSDLTVQLYCDQLTTHLSGLLPSTRYWADSRGHANARGLSIYMPNQHNPAILSIYDSLQFSIGTWWNGMIRSYLGLFDFWIDMSPPGYQNVASGSQRQFTVSLTLKSGSSKPVDLTVNTIPASLGTYSFLPSTLYPSGSSTLTINTLSSAPTQSFYMFVYAQLSGGKLVRWRIFFIEISGATTTVTTSTVRTFQETMRYVPIVAGWTPLDGLTPDAPSLTASSDRLFLAARGMENGIWYRSMDISGTWSPWIPIPGLTDARPAIAAFNGKLYFVCKQQGTNNIWFGSVSLPAGTFSGWMFLDGPTPSAVSLAATDQYLYLAARGMDGSIWHRRMDVAGSWSAWTPIPGLTDVSPAIATFNNRLYFVCKQKSANNIWCGYVDLGLYPNSWFGWTLVSGPTPDSLTATASSDRLYVVARGMENGIWYRSMDTSGAWSSWSQNIWGYTSSAIAVAVYGDSLEFAAREAGALRIWSNRWSLGKMAYLVPENPTVSPKTILSNLISNNLGLVLLSCYMMFRAAFITVSRGSREKHASRRRIESRYVNSPEKHLPKA